MAHLPESQAQFEYTKMQVRHRCAVQLLPRPDMSDDTLQLIGSLGAVAETMRNAATFADQFAQLLTPLTYPGAPLMFPNGQMPQMPPPQAEPTGGKRKARGDDEGEGKRKRKTKPKDPNAPKRPPSSYLLFQNEVRQELKAKHPNIPNNELLAKIARAWGDMPREQKDVCVAVCSLCSLDSCVPHRDTSRDMQSRRIITSSKRRNTNAPLLAPIKCLPQK